MRDIFHLMRSVYFMEAGLSMVLFYKDIFTKLEEEKRQFDSAYDLNAILQECLQELYPRHLHKHSEKLVVTFRGDPGKHALESVKALDHVFIEYKGEFPLDVIFSDEAMARYNNVLQLLAKIERVNFLLAKRE